MKNKRLRALVVALLLVPSVTAFAQGVDLERAEALVRLGKADEAWALLSPHEFDLAGREQFDYLLGVAALDSGRADRATLVFERVLAVNPNHGAARLDMARAYFVLGDHARARQEFETVLRFDPPPPARATIERYLAAMAGRGEAGTSRLTGYIEAGFGHDSNLNAGASGGSFYFPLFSATIASSRKSAAYGMLGGGADLVQPVLGRFDLLAGLDYRQRQHERDWVDATQSRETTFYDSRSLDARLGIQYRAAPRDVLRLTVSHNQYDLSGGDSYRRGLGTLGEWRHSLDERNLVAAFAFDQRLRYGTVEGVSYRMYGGNQVLGGIGGVRLLDAGRSTYVYGSLYGGSERATDVAVGNLDGDKELFGVKLGGQYGLWPSLTLQGSVGFLGSRYDLTNPLFLDRRKDRQTDLVLGAQWRLARDWLLKPQYQYTRSDSNFGAYDFHRHDFSLTLRYDWR